MESKNSYFSSCNGWDVAFLKDISLKIGSGSTPRGGESAYISERTNFAFIRSQNVYDFTFDVTGLRFISDEDANKLKGVHLQKDDVLLNITGDGVTFSRCCLVPEGILPAAVNQHVAIIRLDTTKCLPGYLMAYLCLPETKAYIESFNAGGSRRAITKGHIESFEIPLPPMIIQEHISRVTLGLLAKQNINIKINQTLEQMAQALFKSWFVDFDPVIDNALDAGFFEQDLAFSDELLRRAEAHRTVREHGDSKPLPDAIRQLFPTAFEECAEPSLGLGGWVPKGWIVSTTGDELTVKGGSTPSTANPEFWEGGHIHWTSPKDLSGNQEKVMLDTERRITDAGLNKITSGLLPIETVLMSSRAPIGYLTLTKIPLAINQGYIAIPATKRLSQEYVLYWLNSSMDEIKGIAGGTTFAEISKKTFNSISIIVPSKETIEMFSTLTKSYLNKITLNVVERTTLENLRDTLLPKLISGELRLDDIEADLSKEEVT